MDIRAVDPRDRTWEISQPKYRVYFHDVETRPGRVFVRRVR